MRVTQEKIDQLNGAIQRERLVDTAVRLINVPSPTRSAGAAADCLEDILGNDGLGVERPVAGWPDAPAVVARLDGEETGRTLQFNGHLDTVHLPFVPARVEHGQLYGSGASDMKGGLAAAVEALRALRDTGLLSAGEVLLTAHDLHEAPWGDGSQVRHLIKAGYVGDGVLLPEYLCDRLPVVGRGQAVIEIEITRDGEPVHEVLGGMEQPNVIAAGAEMVRRLREWDDVLSQRTHPLAGCESAFVGKFHAGEMFNQSPKLCRLSGTRRWLPGTDVEDVKRQYETILSETEQAFGVHIDGSFKQSGPAYEIDTGDPLVVALAAAYQFASGCELSIGNKQFVDDGNTFVELAGVPAITHGPDAKGAHTVNEEVAIDELVRVALVYALTAVDYCPA